MKQISVKYQYFENENDGTCERCFNFAQETSINYNMSEKKFHREEYPLDILAEFGLSEQMVYDLPDFVHETIELGGKSPLLPLTIEQPFGCTHLYAKFCLVETEDGMDVLSLRS